MRSDEVSPVPTPGVVRVLFVGDSLTYGTTHVDQRKIFTQIVGRGLPSIVHHSVEVLNASANGWAPDNEWSWVRTRGIFHSNFVLLVLNDGDVTQPWATNFPKGAPSRRSASCMRVSLSRKSCTSRTAPIQEMLFFPTKPFSARI